MTVCLYDSTGTTVIACTTTLANGDYSFPGISNGTYVIKVDPTTLPSTAYYQTGDPDGVKDNQTTVTVNNANVTGKNFGYDQLTGHISGTLCDGTLPGDGTVRRSARRRWRGVPVFLTYAGQDGIIGTADDVVYTTTTDGNGNYSFTNLPPGNYQITKANPTGKTSLADADGGNPNNISVVLDFGPDGIPGNADDRMVKTNQDFEVKPAAGVDRRPGLARHGRRRRAGYRRARPGQRGGRVEGWLRQSDRLRSQHGRHPADAGRPPMSTATTCSPTCRLAATRWTW